MPINALESLLQLHPLPWTAIENWDFGDGTPLSILDANGTPVLAVPGHACLLDDTHDNDHLVAGTLIQLAAAAPQMIEVLGQLLRWAEQMGGWEAPCWARAKALHETLSPRAATAATLAANAPR
jgi:hypothetical protein